MSSNDGGGEQPLNKSPGKGGKSLQLMQQRLLAQQQQQPAQSQPTAASSPPSEIPASANSMDTPADPPLQAGPPGGRPKGKDFAAMSARAPKPSVLASAPTPVAPAAHASSHAAVVSNKPKGKDFTSMASRMGAPQSAPVAAVPAPSQSSAIAQLQAAQAARAAQMQAAARAAAGLPPLKTPTATTVTTTPPHIPPPKISATQRTSSTGATSVPYGSATNVGSGGASGTAQYQPPPTSWNAAHANSQPPQQQQQSMRPSQQPLAQVKHRSAPLTARRGSSGLSQPPPKVSKARDPKPSPVPTASEARVSLQGPHHAAAAYMAPLVGTRIQSLLQSLDPLYVMDPAAEEQVLQLADDFLDKVVKQSLRIAAHRGSKTLDVQDIQLVLGKQWNIVIPGLGPPMPKKPKTSTTTRPSSTVAGTKRKSSGTGAGNVTKLSKSSSSAIATTARSAS